jgi:hypothetical protein
MFIFLITVSSARTENTVTLRYKIFVNAAYTGDLLLTLYQDTFKSNYLSIEKNDRIPFYSASKTGHFVQELYSKHLTFDQREYRIYYDYKNLPKDVYTHQAYRTAQKAFIVDHENRKIRYAIDNIPVVSFENIIIGFIRNKMILSHNDLILFEDGTNSLFRIYFKKSTEKQHIIKLKTQKCSCQTYHCFRQNVAGQPAKNLFVIDVSKTDVPVRIAAVSGRWELVIDDYLDGEMIPVDLDQYILKSATNTFLNGYYKIKQSQLKTPIYVARTHIDKSHIKYRYNIQVNMGSNIKQQKMQAAQYFSKILFSDAYTVYDTNIDKSDSYFQIRVKKNEILNYYAQQNYGTEQIPAYEYERYGENLMAHKLLGDTQFSKIVEYGNMAKYMQTEQNDYVIRTTQKQICTNLYSRSFNTVSYENNTCCISGTATTKVDKIESMIQKDFVHNQGNKKIIKNGNVWYVSTHRKSLPVCQ